MTGELLENSHCCSRSGVGNSWKTGQRSLVKDSECEGVTISVITEDPWVKRCGGASTRLITKYCWVKRCGGRGERQVDHQVLLGGEVWREG